MQVLIMQSCNSEWNQKGPPSPGYSATLADSKKAGFFQYEVLADRTVLILDSSIKFEIKAGHRLRTSGGIKL